MSTTVEALRALYRPASESDRALLCSLAAGLKKYGSLTEKQEALVRAIANRVAPKQRFDLTALHALFDTASEKKAFPKLVLMLGSQRIKLYRAGEKSRTPGAINIVERKRMTEEGERPAYYGKVLPNGDYIQGTTELSGLTTFLAELADNPAEVAALYGQSTGECCFCNRELTDPRSIAVGYGPECAANWGLPWGVKK